MVLAGRDDAMDRAGEPEFGALLHRGAGVEAADELLTWSYAA